MKRRHGFMEAIEAQEAVEDARTKGLPIVIVGKYRDKNQPVTDLSERMPAFCWPLFRHYSYSTSLYELVPRPLGAYSEPHASSRFLSLLSRAIDIQ